MKINLGCGTDIRPGYVNVDFRKTHPDVREVDLSCFPWPFDDQSADEVMMLDFLEHFPMSSAMTILRECNRILRKGGVLVIQVPDMTVLGMALSMASGTPCNACGNTMSHTNDCTKCGQTWSAIREAAIGRLYGGQDYPGNFHQNGFTGTRLYEHLLEAGFVGGNLVEIDHQFLNWNFKMISRKF